MKSQAMRYNIDNYIERRRHAGQWAERCLKRLHSANLQYISDDFDTAEAMNKGLQHQTKCHTTAGLGPYFDVGIPKCGSPNRNPPYGDPQVAFPGP